MLLYNATTPAAEAKAPAAGLPPECAAARPHAQAAHGAHVAHLTVLGLHGLCCLLPIGLSAAVAATGAGLGLAAASGWVEGLHAIVHGHELSLLLACGVLVAAGAGLELWARRGGARRRFPVLLAASVAALAVNAAIVAGHAAPHPHAAHADGPAHDPVEVAATWGPEADAATQDAPAPKEHAHRH